jgi:hypothetical protein
MTKAMTNGKSHIKISASDMGMTELIFAKTNRTGPAI